MNRGLLKAYQGLLVMALMIILSCILSGCKTFRQSSSWDVRDSLRIVDSTRWIVQRMDSLVITEIVNRVDSYVIVQNESGDIISREAYHFQDTNTDRVQIQLLSDEIKILKDMMSARRESSDSTVVQESRPSFWHGLRSWIIGVISCAAVMLFVIAWIKLRGRFLQCP